MIAAPTVSEEAAEICAQKQNLRLLVLGHRAPQAVPALDYKRVTGGILIQDKDPYRHDFTSGDVTVVSRRQPSDAEMRDLLFAWKVVKCVKSNAIVYARDRQTIGIGAGQMSRVDSSRIAAAKAEDAAHAAGLVEPATRGSAVASDAFFPFADGLIAAAEAGASAVIQPGGSIRDEEVIAAADERDLAMVFTGRRHFRH